MIRRLLSLLFLLPSLCFAQSYLYVSSFTNGDGSGVFNFSNQGLTNVNLVKFRDGTTQSTAASGGTGVTSLATANNISGSIAGGTLTLTNTGLRVFNVFDYGAKGNGNVVTDAVMSAGVNLVTSASGGFSNAVVGATIEIPFVGPTAFSSLITTITNVVGTTNVHVAANSTAAIPGSQFVFYGKDDDLPAFNAAKDAAHAAGGGIVYAPSGYIYPWLSAPSNGTFSTGTAYSGQYLIPHAKGAGNSEVLVLMGDVPASFTAPFFRGTVIWSTATNGAVVDAITTAAGGTLMPYATTVEPHFYNLTFSVPHSATLQADILDIGYCMNATVDGCLLRYSAKHSFATNPSAGSTAILLPVQGNGAHIVVRDTQIVGFDKAIRLSEHTSIDRCKFQYNRTAIEIGNSLGATGNAYLDNHIHDCFFFGNNQDIVSGASKAVFVDGTGLIFEDVASGLETTTNNINNSSGWLYGRLVVHKPSYLGALTISGASTNLVVTELNAPRWPMENVTGGHTIITNVANDNTAAGKVVVSGHTATIGTNDQVGAGGSYTNTHTGGTTTGSVIGVTGTGKFYRDDATFASASGISQFDLVNMNFNTGTNINWINGRIWGISNTVTMTGGYMTVIDATGSIVDTNAPPAFTNLTITAWINIPLTNANQTIFGYTVGTNVDAVTFRITPAGLLAVGDGGGQRHTGTGRLPLDKWTFVGMTLEKVTASTANYTLYIDGILDSSSAAATYAPAANISGLTIGSIMNGTQVLTGKVDEIRVSTNILSAADMRFRASEGVKAVNP